MRHFLSEFRQGIFNAVFAIALGVVFVGVCAGAIGLINFIEAACR